MEEGLKILKAEVVNFKGLKPVELDINGKSMMIIGPNGSNKSSFLQALMSPMNAKMRPTEAINKDEERAHIELTIGGTLNGKPEKYDIELRFSQGNKNGRLILKNKDGETLKSPNDSLAAIVGNISFDVDEFIRLAKLDSGKRSEAGVKKQIEILKELLPKAVRDKLLHLDAEYADLYKKRTALNSEIKVLENQNTHEFADEELQHYSAEKQNTEEITKKLNDVGAEIEKWQGVYTGLQDRYRIKDKLLTLGDLEDHQHNYDALVNLIDDFKHPNNQENATFLVHCNKMKSTLNDKIQDLKAMPKLLKEIEDAEAWLHNNPKPSTERLTKDLEAANFFNTKVDEVNKIQEKLTAINKKKDESAKLTERINQAVEDKKKIFSSNPLPVKDLTFDEDNVLFKGLPFNEDHHPSSHIIGIGVKIAMAMNPNLKVIMIKDGSLLDKTTANFILKIVEEAGYQLFIEMVRWEGGDMEMKFIEKEI